MLQKENQNGALTWRKDLNLIEMLSDVQKAMPTDLNGLKWHHQEEWVKIPLQNVTDKIIEKINYFKLLLLNMLQQATE